MFQMKTTLILAIIMCSSYFPAEAQRSFYAGGGGGSGVLQVLPQYETQNRFGGSSTAAPPKPTDSNTLEDPDFLDRVASWPKERQPFWFLNSGYVSNQRRYNVPCVGRDCPTVPQIRPMSTFIRSNNQQF